MKLLRESIDRFFDFDIHVETRTLFLSDSEDGSGVGPKMAEKTIKGLHLLETADASKPITIIMNSMGGSWYDGMAIYDRIRASPCPVIIKVYGSCMSMATLILQAADERVLLPNTTFMIHDGSDYFQGEAKSFEAWGKNSAKLRERMYEIYAEGSKHDTSFWKKKCASDFIINAEEAVEFGLADKVEYPDPEEPSE